MNRTRIQKLLGFKKNCRKCDVIICLSDIKEKNTATEEYVENIVCNCKTTYPDLRIIALVHQA